MKPSYEWPQEKHPRTIAAAPAAATNRRATYPITAVLDAELEASLQDEGLEHFLRPVVG